MIEDDFEFWWHARAVGLLVYLQKMAIRTARGLNAAAGWAIRIADQLDSPVKRHQAELDWGVRQMEKAVDRLRTELGLLHEKKGPLL